MRDVKKVFCGAIYEASPELPVKLSRHLGSVFDMAAVNQPIACRDGGSERDAVIDKRQWCVFRDVFPVCSVCPSCVVQRKVILMMFEDRIL